MLNRLRRLPLNSSHRARYRATARHSARATEHSPLSLHRHQSTAGPQWELLSTRENDAASERQHRFTMHEYRHRELGTRLVHVQPCQDGEDGEIAHTPHHFRFGLTLRTPAFVPEKPLAVLTQQYIVQGAHTGRRHSGASRDVFSQIYSRNTLNANSKTPPTLSDTHSSFRFVTSNRKDMLNMVDVATDAVLNARFTQEDMYRNLLMPAIDRHTGSVMFEAPYAAHLMMSQTLSQTVLRTETGAHLFEGTVLENGGPLGTLKGLYDTRYEDLVQYYRQFYHPGNAMLISYGAMTPETVLKHLDQTTFSSMEDMWKERSGSDIDRTLNDLLNRKVERWNEPRTVRCMAPEHDGFLASNKDRMVAFAFLTESDWQKDPLRSYALSVLYASLRDPFGPLMDAMGEKHQHLANTLDDIFTSRINLPDDYFAIGFDSIHEEDIGKLESIFHEALTKIAERGYPERYIEKLLNRERIAYRDSNYSVGRVFEDVTTQWTRFSERPAIDGILLNSRMVFQNVKSPMHHGNFNQFVKETVRSLLIENPHRLTVIVEPEQATEASVNLKFDTLGKEYAKSQRSTIEEIMPRVQKQVVELREMKRDLKVPSSTIYETDGIFTINDIPIQPPPSYLNHELSEEYSDNTGDKQILFNEQSDNDNVVDVSCYIYPRFAFRGDLRSYLPLMARLIETLGARAMTNDDLKQTMLQYTFEGISIDAIPIRESPVHGSGNTYALVLSGKCLYSNIYKMMDLFTAIVSESELTRHMDDKERRQMIDHMIEIIQSEAWETQTRITQDPAYYVSQNAASYLNMHSHNVDAFSGMIYVQFLQTLMQKIEENAEEAGNILDMVTNFMRALYSVHGGVKVVVTSSSEHKDTVVDAVSEFIGTCFAKAELVEDDDTMIRPEEEEFKTETGRYYIEVPSMESTFIMTQAIETVPRGHADAPALLVASFLLSNYFERTVRSMGGAQVTCIYDPSGAFVIQSADDSQPFETQRIIQSAIDSWLKEEMFSTEELDRAKLDVFHKLQLDIVREPHDRAAGALTRVREETQFRKAILATRSEDIARVANYLVETIFDEVEEDPMAVQFQLQEDINKKNIEILKEKGEDVNSLQVEEQQVEEEQTHVLHREAGEELTRRPGAMVLLGPVKRKLRPDILEQLEFGWKTGHE